MAAFAAMADLGPGSAGAKTRHLQKFFCFFFSKKAALISFEELLAW
jgi:hypothetical protein